MKLSSVALLISLLAASPAFATEADVSVCFTPAQQCEPLIVQAIDQAKSSISVQAYAFSSFPIIHALERAGARGVEVLVILDKINDRKYSAATLLQAHDIPVWIDYEPRIAHNKVIVIDDFLTIGGSYNYTKSAETRNAENVTFIRSKTIADRFLANWASRLKVSKVFGLNDPSQ